MNKLDKLLQEWAGRRKIQETKLRLLTETICREVRYAKRETLPENAGSKGISLLWLRITYASLGVMAAACFLVTFLRQQMPVPIVAVPEGRIESAPLTRTAAISPEDMGNNLKVLREMNNVFPEELRWIQASGKRIDLGLASQAGESGIQADCVMIRLVIFKREIGGAWQNIWTAEVMTVPEEVVRIPLEGKTGNYLSFWTHLLPDGLLALDSDIRLKLPVELATCFSGILKPGIPQRVLSLNTGDIEYCIFEAVTYLQLNTSKGV